MTHGTELWLEESPIDVVQGSQIMFSIVWTGKTTGTAPSAAIYKNNKDLSSSMFVKTLQLDGTYKVVHSISDGTPPVMTLADITFGKGSGGSEFVLVVQATVDGQAEIHKALIRCVKPGATQ